MGMLGPHKPSMPHQPRMIHSVENHWLGQVCGQITVGDGPILLALFLAGLGGSVTHCLTMCSGFVLGQTRGLEHRGVLARLLLPYHAGRLTTYAGLGIVAASSLYLVSAWSGFSVLRHLLLGFVAMVFLSLFADRLLKRVGVRLPFRLPAVGGCSLVVTQRLKAISGALKRYGLGLVLGFLPCPLVFAALLAVASTADPLLGGLGMILFGLGTMPALLGLAFASSNILNRSPRFQDGLTMAALGVNGVILLTVAVG
jgi:uncharacterized protein